MCDKSNPHDKKLLLLAELVETKCEALSRNQKDLKDSLNKTNEKLDKLTSILEKYEEKTSKCPAYKDKEGLERLMFVMSNPKTSILILLGIIALLGGFFGANFTELFKMLVGL